jgi:hypothetical protein
LKDLGDKEVEYEVTKWGADRQRVTTKHKAVVRNLECIAWAVEKETGGRIESPRVSVEMAVKEGWYGKSGSKWQTMPEVMLRYRTASFFGKIYAPELLMGLSSVEESQDVIIAEKDDSGKYFVDVDSLKRENVNTETGEIIEAEKPRRKRAEKSVEPDPVLENEPASDLFNEVEAGILSSKTIEKLEESAILICQIENPEQNEHLQGLYMSRRNELESDE